ncbi:hypothetical protein MNBD_GAMMA13-72 [hydrothermal vent metagenome]|uniref:Uncharacterized protein n=1 Tax=hydrothermal vent metagenome TaxID=652676 RepID=A0A3B0YHZ8_9ZZZZ
MRKKCQRKIFYSALIASFVTLSTGNVAYAHQIGTPLTPVFVSTDAGVQDTVNCGSRQQPCRSIQQAVHRVAVGGVIQVDPGRYFENILVDKEGISLTATGSYGVTFIDAGNSTNNTVPEAVRIIADDVLISGFTLMNSVASGLFNIGNNVTVTGNAARSNSGRGFQFGISTRGASDGLDNSARVVADDPLNGATSVPDAALQSQQGVQVSNNIANRNALGGFYFSAFDLGNVSRNFSIFSGDLGLDTPQPGTPEVSNLGFGSGFWIDSGSNDDILSENIAFENSGHGIFYRRGFGAFPAGLVTNQLVTRNLTFKNRRNGIMLMGHNLLVTDNRSSQNGGDGMHFIGYDTVSNVSYNAVSQNGGAGIGFSNFAGTMQVRPISLDPQGIPTDNGGVHHNIIEGNLGNKIPTLGAIANCGIATDVVGSTIELANNVWNSAPAPSPAQRICDASNSTIIRISTSGFGGAGPRPIQNE